MKALIGRVRLSKRDMFIGESVRVEVKTTDPSADVTIGNIVGGSQYLQFDEAGSHTIVISASLGKRQEEVARRVKVRELDVGKPAYPLIRSTMDRYQPRTVYFSLAAGDPSVASYEWDFGDGTTAASRGNVLALETYGLVKQRCSCTARDP